MRPVGERIFLRKLHIAVLRDQKSIRRLLILTKQRCCDLRIEHRSRQYARLAQEYLHVLAARMEDLQDVWVREGTRQRFQARKRERIDDRDHAFDADLH